MSKFCRKIAALEKQSRLFYCYQFKWWSRSTHEI